MVLAPWLFCGGDEVREDKMRRCAHGGRSTPPHVQPRHNGHLCLQGDGILLGGTVASVHPEGISIQSLSCTHGFTAAGGGT